MKNIIVLFVALMVITACTKKVEKTPISTATPAPGPAPTVKDPAVAPIPLPAFGAESTSVEENSQATESAPNL